MADFKPGDRVQLISGGPIMTVEKIDAYEDVVCAWFDGTYLTNAPIQWGQSRHDTFSPASLRKVE